jgi:Schlafen, AlbA_2
VPDVAPSIIALTVLATGALLAAVMRLLFRNARRLTWSATIVTAVLGAALAWLPLDLAAVAAGSWVRLPIGLAGSAVAVGIASAGLAVQQRRRAKGVPGASAEQLIAGGETERVELKSTARWNTRSGAKDERIESEVAITVAGFMNAGGGTLLVGVDDEGHVLGLADDLAVMPGRDRDGFELWLRTMLAERLGRAVTADIGVSFPVVDGREICRIDVAPADRPVFLGAAGGARTADFHLRVGNATRRLLSDEVLEYTARRWR